MAEAIAEGGVQKAGDSSLRSRLMKAQQKPSKIDEGRNIGVDVDELVQCQVKKIKEEKHRDPTENERREIHKAAEEEVRLAQERQRDRETVNALKMRIKQ